MVIKMNILAKNLNFLYIIASFAFLNIGAPSANAQNTELIKEKEKCVSSSIKKYIASSEGKDMINNFRSRGLTCVSADGTSSVESIDKMLPESKEKILPHIFKDCVNMSGPQVDLEFEAVSYSIGSNFLTEICNELGKNR